MPCGAASGVPVRRRRFPPPPAPRRYVFDAGAVSLGYDGSDPPPDRSRAGRSPNGRPGATVSDGDAGRPRRGDADAEVGDGRRREETAPRNPGGFGPRSRGLAWAALFGFAAWVVAILVVGLIGLTGDPPVSDDVPLWKGLVWYFLDAQFVPILETSGRETVTVDVLSLLESRLTVLTYPAPPVALAVAGLFFARTDRLDDVGLSPAWAGLALAPGYLVPTILLAAASAHTVTVSLVVVDVVKQITPQLGVRLLLAAVGYPVVFGGIGGVLAARLRSD